VLIKGEHKDECIRYGSNLEACTFVVNQDQAFEAGVQMKLIVYEAKWNSKWIG
jgi:hypothetical protein